MKTKQSRNAGKGRNMDVASVITQNRELQKKARDLNVRAGEMIFSVLSQSELQRWLSERLHGAQKISEVAMPEALLLPPLDADVAHLVLAQNPDEITVGLLQLTVTYREGSAPYATLSQQAIAEHLWKELPDEGVQLPSGRLVEVVVPFGYYESSRSQNIPELKAACARRVHQRMWDQWPTEGRPEMALPDPSDTRSDIPPICACRYGVSLIDGSELLAYGTISKHGYRYYTSDSYFQVQWFQSKNAAERARAEAICLLDGIREEAIQQRRLAEASAAADAVVKQLQLFDASPGWYEVDGDLRSRVQHRSYAVRPTNLENLQNWVATSENLVDEANAALRVLAETKAAEEARIAAAEKSGSLLRKLEVTCDTRYGRGHVWVICGDGSLRTHNSARAGSTSRYTCYTWSMISEELVIAHEIINIAGVEAPLKGGTGIIWRPLTITPAQIKALEKIEGTFGLGGTFEVEPTLVAKRAVMIEEIRKEILRMSPQEAVSDLSFQDVSGEHGRILSHPDPRQLVSWTMPFSASCEGRKAQIVKAVPCAGGILEFLVYEKWGRTNLNARWRARHEEVQITPVPITPPSKPTPTAQPADTALVSASLDALKAKFNKKR